MKKVIFGLFTICCLLSMILLFEFELSVRASPKAMSFSTDPTAFIAVVNPVDGTNEFCFSPDTPIGTTFVVNITCSNAQFLGAWQINIAYDPTLLDISSNSDLILPSDNVFGAYVYPLYRERGTGYVLWIVGLPLGKDYVNVTYGTMCQIRFTLIKNDTKPLSSDIHFLKWYENLFCTKLVLYNGSLIPSIAIDGIFKMGTDTSKIYGVETLWNNSMAVNDVAVSKYGNYIAAVNDTGVYFFASSNPQPKWWYLESDPIENFTSVAISADGEYVVAGGTYSRLYYFNDSKASTNQRSSPTWASKALGEWIEKGTLDMSDYGEYVVVGGTGDTLYYFAECKERSGSDENPTWSSSPGPFDFFTVHVSSDGKYVAAGGANWPSGGFVIFYANANAILGPSTSPNWTATSSINSTIKDLAVSNDGYTVAAIDYAHLHYWANATSLSGDPNATWTKEGDGDYFSLDISSDGDEVICGMGSPMPCGLHFWTGARVRSGPDQAEDWIRFEGSVVWDVAISNDGGIIAASVENNSSYEALFFKSDGIMIGEFDLLQFSPLVSMSRDGGITTVAGPGPFSLHVFKTLDDLTPPIIADVYQDPNTVYPYDKVMVYANVTDDESGVKNAFITYTNETGTWIANMSNLEGNKWNGTIPEWNSSITEEELNEFAKHSVRYIITAEDNVGNIITSEQIYGEKEHYTVLPEFPSNITIPLVMIVTLIAVIVYKRKLFHRIVLT